MARLARGEGECAGVLLYRRGFSLKFSSVRFQRPNGHCEYGSHKKEIMSKEEFFKLGQNFGQLKNLIDNRFQKIEENFLLWGVEVNSNECQKLAEARQLLFSVEINVKNERENIHELSETMNAARCLWQDIVINANFENENV